MLTVVAEEPLQMVQMEKLHPKFCLLSELEIMEQGKRAKATSGANCGMARHQDYGLYTKIFVYILYWWALVYSLRRKMKSRSKQEVEVMKDLKNMKSSSTFFNFSSRLLVSVILLFFLFFLLSGILLFWGGCLFFQMHHSLVPNML